MAKEKATTPAADTAPTTPPPAGGPKSTPKAKTQASSETMTGTPIGTAVMLEQAVPKFRPPWIVIYAVEGWGKTSLAAFTPKPAILMAKGETGYSTLLGNGMVPAMPAATIENWPDLMATLTYYADPETELPFKTLIQDAMGGFESMCHQMVCNRDYGGDWGDKGFMSFHKGYKTALPDWDLMLALLEQIRDKGVMIIQIGHHQIKNTQNPMGADYDSYICDLNKDTWSRTCRQADTTWFGKFKTIVDVEKGKKKGKGIGGTSRVIYTEQCDAFTAKNRYRLPPEILMHDGIDGPQESWNMMWKLITANAQ